MVNTKYVAFKVNQQTPNYPKAPKPYGTVLNCRKRGGKKGSGEQREVRSHHVSLINAPGSRKRKWGDQEKDHDTDGTTSSATTSETYATTSATPPGLPLPAQNWQPRPTKLLVRKPLNTEIALDCWFEIWCFCDPAQLLEMRRYIPIYHRTLSKYPKLWQHSRKNYYGDDMPDPPTELTEFQYADLRHGHGCMSCDAKNTRKTYWAFLRRWCKDCLQKKVIREADATAMLKDADRGSWSFLLKCLPSGVFDSWCNFVGAGPAKTHSVKTVYLRSDVQKLVDELLVEREKNPLFKHDEILDWMAPKSKLVEERREFARKMEQWEDATRSTKASDYQAKKAARKAYYQEKASELDPPITRWAMEHCPSYLRAITIPKEPSNASWLQLKPKLEKEAAEWAAEHAARGGQEDRRSVTVPDFSTPERGLDAPQPYMHHTQQPFVGPNLSLPSHPFGSFGPDDALRFYQPIYGNGYGALDIQSYSSTDDDMF